MNELVGRLGLQGTQFRNAHGLSEAGHYASAYDLAMLARYAMTLPDFAPLAATRQWSAQGSRTIYMNNVNTFLSRYPGADGVKTGYTEVAGRTLVASAALNGKRVYVALLNAPRRDEDAQALFDWAFRNFVWG
jgi:D-alanyl-D-alanine carboxypeptidase